MSETLHLQRERKLGDRVRLVSNGNLAVVVGVVRNTLRPKLVYLIKVDGYVEHVAMHPHEVESP